MVRSHVNINNTNVIVSFRCFIWHLEIGWTPVYICKCNYTTSNLFSLLDRLLRLISKPQSCTKHMSYKSFRLGFLNYDYKTIKSSSWICKHDRVSQSQMRGCILLSWSLVNGWIKVMKSVVYIQLCSQSRKSHSDNRRMNFL